MVVSVAGLMMWACDDYEGEQHVPAYISLDAITVEDVATDSWSTEDGFFSSAIDAAQLLLYFDGDTAETVLGTFQLPCKVPVLRQGKPRRLTVVPVVIQNGITGTRIYYPYYKTIDDTSVVLVPGQVSSLGTLTTNYQPRSQMQVLWKEFFEPGAQSISLDTVVSRIELQPDTVCSGLGCGVIRVNSSQKSLSFWYDTFVYVPNSGAYVYLELDYWSDFNFSIGFNNPMTQGGANQIYSALVLKPNKHWDKIYVNLGRLWTEYNHYPLLRPYFTILNDEGRSGRLMLDNIKLVVM